MSREVAGVAMVVREPVQVVALLAALTVSVHRYSVPETTDVMLSQLPRCSSLALKTVNIHSPSQTNVPLHNAAQLTEGETFMRHTLA